MRMKKVKKKPRLEDLDKVLGDFIPGSGKVAQRLKRKRQKNRIDDETGRKRFPGARQLDRKSVV